MGVVDAEAIARKRLENNGRNTANNNAGILLGSDLHLCEMLLAEIDKLRARTTVEQACEPWKHCTGGPPDWDSPLQNVWQAACCWTLDIVGRALGAEDWECGDGSETIDGDIAAEVGNIMRAAGLVNKDGDMITKADLAAKIADHRDEGR